MKLDTLHLATTKDIREELDPSAHEKLAFLQMMVAKQNKDPEPIIKRIRGMLDPEFAQKEGRKATFERWLKGAAKDETKVGRTHGRKVRITVLESTVRELINEGFFADVGSAIMRKLKSVINDEPTEHQMVTKALDEYPQLAWIARYSRKATRPLYTDPDFWAKLNDTTGGLADKIKTLVDATHKKVAEAREATKQENLNLLSECVIEEAKISDVMADLGLEPEAVQSLMGDYDVRDEDYDIARLKEAWRAAGGKVSKAIEALKEAPKTVKKRLARAPRTAAEFEKIRQSNEDFADAIILSAAFMLKTSKHDVSTPEKAKEAVEETAEELEEISPREAAAEIGAKKEAKPEVVSARELTTMT